MELDGKPPASCSARKGAPAFLHSEPEFLISYMDRHKDWAVIVCLVGGGQEINIGEAGIDAWLDAVNRSFPDWEMFISSRLIDSEYAAGKALEVVRNRPRAHFDDSLHLAVSMRSFRAENVSAFVKALLDCEKEQARTAFAELAARYPIAITRDLNAAKQWVRSRARGTERYGLVASSKAMRLKPHAIDIRVSVDPVHYFLNERNDTRSSFYLEDAATEFQVQGLELDWVCVTWDGDFRFNGSGWDHHDFRYRCDTADDAKREFQSSAQIGFEIIGDVGAPCGSLPSLQQSCARISWLGDRGLAIKRPRTRPRWIDRKKSSRSKFTKHSFQCAPARESKYYAQQHIRATSASDEFPQGTDCAAVFGRSISSGIGAEHAASGRDACVSERQSFGLDVIICCETGISSRQVSTSEDF